jgi:hypothetical protein
VKLFFVYIPLLLSNNIFSCPLGQWDAHAFLAETNFAISKCHLVKRQIRKNEIHSLSSFWAQEYTGADLLNQRIQELKLDNPSQNLIEIWDTGQGRFKDHGDYVENLIWGPHPSAVLHSERQIGFKELEFNESEVQDRSFSIDETNMSRYVTNYTKNCADIASGNDGECPAYINNSMEWFQSKQISNSIESLIDTKPLVFITSADNDGQLVDPEKEKLMKSGTILGVTSHDPNGNPSDFTNFSPGAVISAPSGRNLTSFVDDQPRLFGGTSGAAPQVTGALAAFTHLTGHRLTTKQAKSLLEYTAIKFPEYPVPSTLGAGMLNSYKIGDIAIKLNQECHHQEDVTKCINMFLDDVKKLENLEAGRSVQSDLISRFKLLFSDCQSPIEELSFEDCEARKEIFEQIRKEAFLDPHNPKLWEAISCMSQADGLPENANYYKNLAERNQSGVTDEGLVRNLIEKAKKTKDPIQIDLAIGDIIRYVLIHPKHATNINLISQIIEQENVPISLFASVIGKFSDQISEEGMETILTKIKEKNNPQLDTWLMQFVFSHKKVVDEHSRLLADILARSKKNDNLMTEFFKSVFPFLNDQNPIQKELRDKYSKKMKKYQTPY